LKLKRYLKSFKSKNCNFYTKRPSYVDSIGRIESFLNRMINIDCNKKTPYFAWSISGLFTHDDMAVPLDYDRRLVEMLKTFEKMNAFNNTMLIVNGDHGLRLNSYFFDTNEAKIERKQPFLSIRLPTSLLKSEFSGNMVKNKDKLVTSYDVYQTLKQFLYLNQNIEMNGKCRGEFRVNSRFIRNKRGTSLFEPIKVDRSCAEALISEMECSFVSTIIPINEITFIQQTNWTFNRLNDNILQIIVDKTKDYRSKCQHYQFDKLVSLQNIISNYDRNKVINKYEAVVLLQPDDSKFEINFQVNTENNSEESFFKVLNVLRMNKYGNTADCIKKYDSKLVFFCYCI
jgi:hypothetical protein